MKRIFSFLILVSLLGCSKDNGANRETVPSTPVNPSNPSNLVSNIEDPQSSSYVLPYPVGESHNLSLGLSGDSYHDLDQFSVDFDMQIGSLITAARSGVVVHIEESGEDFGLLNNLVVLKHADGTYAQYMHLTKDGAIPSLGSSLDQGDPIGWSGATGNVEYPHLHFAVTQNDWTYPYVSMPFSFRNTDAKAKRLESGKRYKAIPY